MILCFNARSLKNRKRAADIAALLDMHSADIVAINETWLSADVLDHEVIPTDYVVLRKDRVGGKRPAGGVLLAILPHLQPRRQIQLETSAEAVWAELTISNVRVLIASVYRAPNSSVEQNEELLRSLSLAAEQQHNYDALFVMGDLNLEIDWNTEAPIPKSTVAEKFLDSFDSLAFAQLIKSATRTTATTEKIIDLFLSDTPTLVSSSEVTAGISDHDALLVHLKMDSRRPTPISTTVPDWQRANWPMLNELLEVRLQAVQAKDDLFTAWEEWKTILFECVANCVPNRRQRSKKRLLPWLDKVQEPKLNQWRISVGDVENQLKTLDIKSATGPDGIPAVLLKNCASTLCPSLAHIFQLSILASDLPMDWKNAAVTPVPKEGEKTNFKNYRPISVTSIVGKLLEKHVRNQLAAFLEQTEALPDGQHGFRSRRSCTTMLLRTLDSWTAALDSQSGARIHAVFLDWSKAFDKVPHRRLLNKLQFHGVDGAALKWLQNFLVGRSQFVRYNGAHSEPCEVTSGVIQGSCLGPLLFNLFAADLPAVVNTNLVQYADDCTVFNNIKSDDDIDALQDDLARIDIWCLNNGMQLNAKKCVVMDVTRARLPCNPRYTIGGVTLQYVATQRLLGVHLSRDLRWNHHVDVQRKKALQTLGFAARNLRGCTLRVKRIAYLSLVKPKLFYGSPAWHPSTKTNTEKMIRVQNRALHFIHGRRIPPPIQQNFLSVPAQLVYNDLLFFKKCLAGVTDYDAMARITQGRVHRGDDPLHPRLQQPPARTDLGKNVFDFRVVKEWNDMPPALKDCSAAQFPSTCKAYVISRY
ncbi:Hypothetical predicted protein [Cloeon dipterum]|uniref:Reverse transcriptase domain-containing protein n=1 Tax=Cloeon dipterum TaxID=197152 RepID=A0A8S1E4I1_9INSE|nr:Hypothetical predicted protein [Cloeon dipterum]